MTPNPSPPTPDLARSTGESTALLAARLAMGGLLLFSAWMKLKNNDLFSGPYVFSTSVAAFNIVPDKLVPFVSFAIPWTEAAAAVALLLGVFTRGAGLVAFALLVTFTLGVASVVLRKMNVNCGCFGKNKLLCQGPLGWCKVGENMILIAIAMIPMARGGGRWALDSCRCCRSRACDPAPSAA